LSLGKGGLSPYRGGVQGGKNGTKKKKKGRVPSTLGRKRGKEDGGSYGFVKGMFILQRREKERGTFLTHSAEKKICHVVSTSLGEEGREKKSAIPLAEKRGEFAPFR